MGSMVSPNKQIATEHACLEVVWGFQHIVLPKMN